MAEIVQSPQVAKEPKSLFGEAPDPTYTIGTYPYSVAGKELYEPVLHKNDKPDTHIVYSDGLG